MSQYLFRHATRFASLPRTACPFRTDHLGASTGIPLFRRYRFLFSTLDSSLLQGLQRLSRQPGLSLFPTRWNSSLGFVCPQSLQVFTASILLIIQSTRLLYYCKAYCTLNLSGIGVSLIPHPSVDPGASWSVYGPLYGPSSSAYCTGGPIARFPRTCLCDGPLLF